MLQDARDIRQKVENARKLHAMEQAKMKERQKKDVYNSVQQKISDVKKKQVKEKKNRIRFNSALVFMKISGIAALFVFLAFALHSAFKENRPATNVKILVQEEPADELETAMAAKYFQEIVDDVSENGLKSLEDHWSQNANEESRVYGEEIFASIGESSSTVESVKKIGNGCLKLKCVKDGHPFSVCIQKDAGSMSVLSVN